MPRKAKEDPTTAERELAEHREGVVDPTGHVSSGLQTAPLRPTDRALAHDDLNPLTDPEKPEKASDEAE